MIALIYHDVVETAKRDEYGFLGPAADRYKLSPERFVNHLDAIAATGAACGRVADPSALPALALTFDDGGASAMYVADRLEEHGWYGNFFVTTSRIGTDGFLTAAQIVELKTRGHLIGSHSHSHPAVMASLSRPQLLDEWTRSARLLSDITGDATPVAAVPGGALSRSVLEAADDAGYTIVLTSEPSTRSRRVGNALVIGRFGIWATTDALRVEAIVRGKRTARWSAWLAWNAKKPLKRLSPRAYEALRKARH